MTLGTLKQLKFTGLVFMAGFALAAVYGAVGPRLHASALQGVIVMSNGSFNGTSGVQNGDSIPSGVNSAITFETYINYMLNNTAWGSVPGSDYNKYGAAFIVETMMHGKGTGTFTANSALVTSALNDYPTWKLRIEAYAAAGKITWSTSTTLPAGTTNSTHVCNTTSHSTCNDAAVYYNNDVHGGGTDAKKLEFFVNGSSEASTLITFTNSDGKTFQIRRECGNVVGQVTPLNGNYDWALAGTTTKSASDIYPLDTVTFTNKVKNNGPYNADFTWYVRYCFDACSGGYNSGYTQAQTGTKTNLAANSTMPVSPDWTYTPSDNTHTQICAWIAYTAATGPSTAAGHSTWQCTNIDAPSSTCGAMTISPLPIQSTTSYALTSSVKVTGGLAGANSVNSASNYYVHITGPNSGTYPYPSYKNDNVTPVTTGTSGAYGTLATTYTPGATNNVGTYSVTWGITGSVANINCGPQTFTVAYYPYFSVVAGDIAAGPGFGDGCGESDANIQSWSNNTTSAPNYFAGGSELGALATGQITNFVSGLGLVGNSSPPTTGSFIAPPISGYGLSFANVNNGTDEAASPPDFGYGGDVGSLACIDDYFGTEDDANPTTGEPSQITNATVNTPPAPATPMNGAYEIDPDPNPAQHYVTLGDSLHTPIAINANKTITLYVAGDVYIDSNIVYGAYTTMASIPRFNLYVSGDVFIDPAVTKLEGVFIAQASGTATGDINTCATPATTTGNPESYTACKNQLLVIGSMAAEGSLKLSRTHGNLSAVAINSVLAEPAEIFQYSPELWLYTPPSAGPGVKAYTSLPPVL